MPQTMKPISARKIVCTSFPICHGGNQKVEICYICKSNLAPFTQHIFADQEEKMTFIVYKHNNACHAQEFSQMPLPHYAHKPRMVEALCEIEAIGAYLQLIKSH